MRHGWLLGLAVAVCLSVGLGQGVSVGLGQAPPPALGQAGAGGGPSGVGGTAKTQPKPKEPVMGVVVNLDGLKSETPGNWIVEKPANRLRSHQFRLPAVGEDTADAELAILPNVQGTAEQNIQRWKETFVPPSGKTLKEVSKVEKFTTVGKASAVMLDVHGTYLYKDRPFDPTAKVDVRPGYRMLTVILETKENIHQIRLTGPYKTVERYKKSFEDWVRAFQ
jgi:hypothetical protein